MMRTTVFLAGNLFSVLNSEAAKADIAFLISGSPLWKTGKDGSIRKAGKKLMDAMIGTNFLNLIR